MKITNPIHATIKRRYKRFFADLLLDDGTPIIAHVPNTGSMKKCWEDGWPSIVTYHQSSKRKLAYTLELTSNHHTWIGINTSRTNALALEAIEKGIIAELTGYQNIIAEYTIGDSRLDLHLSSADRPPCFVEIKNVTLIDDQCNAIFPDSVSARGAKHLKLLTELAKSGNRAVMLYIVQRQDANSFSPAANIDPIYAECFYSAQDAGVEMLAYQCMVKPEEIVVSHKLPLKKY